MRKSAVEKQEAVSNCCAIDIANRAVNHFQRRKLASWNTKSWKDECVFTVELFQTRILLVESSQCRLSRITIVCVKMTDINVYFTYIKHGIGSKISIAIEVFIILRKLCWFKYLFYDDELNSNRRSHLNWHKIQLIYRSY